MSSLAPGTMVGHYRLAEPLGQGGFGSVHRALDTKLQRWVAVKVLTRTGEAERARLVVEARAAAALAHPFVVHVYAVEQEAEHDFLVMELVAGRSLRQRLADATLRQKVAWLEQVAEALAAAHAAGFVHRDVKPDNVLVVDATQTVKVLDFGIAKRIGAAPSDAHVEETPVTQAGHVVGTPKYLAPEQALGKPVTPLIDQWSWGILAYELLAGQHPAKVVGASHVLEWVVVGVTRDLGELVPELAPHLARTVMRAISRDETARFPTMGALLEEWRSDGARPPVPTLITRPEGHRAAEHLAIPSDHELPPSAPRTETLSLPNVAHGPASSVPQLVTDRALAEPSTGTTPLVARSGPTSPARSPRGSLAAWLGVFALGAIGAAGAVVWNISRSPAATAPAHPSSSTSAMGPPASLPPVATLTDVAPATPGSAAPPIVAKPPSPTAHPVPARAPAHHRTTPPSREPPAPASSAHPFDDRK